MPGGSNCCIGPLTSALLDCGHIQLPLLHDLEQELVGAAVVCGTRGQARRRGHNGLKAYAEEQAVSIPVHASRLQREQ